MLSAILDAGTQRAEQVPVRQSADLHVIRLVDLRFRRGDARRPFAVVAQQQKPSLALSSRPTGATHGNRIRQKRIDRVASALVARGRHVAARFVEHQVDAFGGLYVGAVEREPVRLAATGVSGSRTTRPLTATRPSRTYSAAWVREQMPSLDSTRATPCRVSGVGFARVLRARVFGMRSGLRGGVGTR